MAIADMPTPTDSRQASLEALVVLMVPTMGWWRGCYKLTKAEVTVDGQAIDKKSISSPHIQLWAAVPDLKPWKERLQTLETEKTNILDAFSQTFEGIPGVRIVPRQATPRLLQRLLGQRYENGKPRYDPDLETQSVAYRLGEVADEFQDSWEYPIQDQIRRALPSHIWEAVKPKLPSSDDLRKLFYLELTPLYLRLDDQSPDLRDAAIALQEATSRRVEEAIAAMVAGPREELAKALDELHELIARDARVTVRSFHAVQAAIEKLRLFGFMADASLLAKISEFEATMGATRPADLDSTVAANNGLFDAIASVRNDVTNAVARAQDVARFGRARRFVAAE